MKVEDFISKHIQQYPLLYKDSDYEKSQLKVLDHIFFTVGNGFEYAQCTNPKEGGYIVDPMYKKDRKTDEWIRLEDPPYGTKSYKKLPKNYFNSRVYILNTPKEIVRARGIRHINIVYYNTEPQILLAESKHNFKPYPICQYSMGLEIAEQDIFLHEDWLRSLLILCERSLKYYNNPEEYNPGNISQYNIQKNYLTDKIKQLDSNNITDIITLRKQNEFEDGITIPTEEEINRLLLRKFNEHGIAQINYLNKILTYVKEKLI